MSTPSDRDHPSGRAPPSGQNLTSGQNLPLDQVSPTDEDLVAYLDGELAQEARAALARTIASRHDVQQRLLELSGGARPFREAFAPLLDAAPRERLDAMLARLAVPQPVPSEALPSPSAPSLAVSQRPVPSRPGPSRLAVGLGALAAAVLLFVAGAGTGVAWLSGLAPLQALLPASDHEAEEDWREAVAQYLTLYTPETLASIPDDADLRRRELATVGARLGLALPPETVALPGLPLKRAQIFAYDERPLGQVGFLDPSSGPLALCITTGAGAGPALRPALREERRQGFNIVFWDTGRHRLMLIGRAPFERLRALASLLADRLPA